MSNPYAIAKGKGGKSDFMKSIGGLMEVSWEVPVTPLLS